MSFGPGPGAPPGAPDLTHLPEVGSTMDVAADQAARGRSDHAILADLQTGGRGRSGRRWVSPPGNLYVTLILRWPWALTLMPPVSLAAAASVASRLAPALPSGVPPIRLKWPNDLRVEGRKLGGVLLQAVDGPDQSVCLLVGVGVNLVTVPAGLDQPALSLADLGAAIPDRPVLARALLADLCGLRDKLADGDTAALLDAWRARAEHAPGDVMTVRTSMNTQIPGTFLGIDAAGALRLRTDSGEQTFTAGDVLTALPLPTSP